MGQGTSERSAGIRSLASRPSLSGFHSRLRRPLVADVAIAAAVFLLLFAVVALIDAADVPLPPSDASLISDNPASLPYYALRSMLRMMIALLLSYAFALLFGFWAARNRKAEQIMVPALDICNQCRCSGSSASRSPDSSHCSRDLSSGWRPRQSSRVGPVGNAAAVASFDESVGYAVDEETLYIFK